MLARVLLRSRPGVPAVRAQTWTIPGTYAFTVPTGVTALSITLLAGGGGGGGGDDPVQGGDDGQPGGASKIVYQAVTKALTNGGTGGAGIGEGYVNGTGGTASNSLTGGINTNGGNHSGQTGGIPNGGNGGNQSVLGGSLGPGGGGGGGAKITGTLPVTAGTVVTVTVGGGGNGGPGAMDSSADGFPGLNGSVAFTW